MDRCHEVVGLALLREAGGGLAEAGAELLRLRGRELAGRATAAVTLVGGCPSWCEPYCGGREDGYPCGLAHRFPAEIRNPFAALQGPEGFAELARNFTDAFSERRIEILGVVDSGAAAVAQIRVRTPCDAWGGGPLG